MKDMKQVKRTAIWDRIWAGSIGPVTVLLVFIFIAWYLGAIALNSPFLIDRYKKNNPDWTFMELTKDSWSMDRPVLPAPHQIAIELKKTIIDRKITSKRSLVYHAGVTLSSAMLGFIMGTLLGIVLAIGIVHIETLDKSLMPWVIASQTIPILAIAPMIIVVLGSMGITGVLPKAVISTYLCFFPVTVGMVKGLRSPNRMHLDLMRNYHANNSQIFWKLRLPSSIPYLFSSLKVAVALSLVGAIVAELPSGAQAGLGSRLLSGSYYGQTSLIWAALITASVISALLVAIVSRIEKSTVKRMGFRS